MNNSKLDWKGVGQFLAMLVQVFSILRDVANKAKVGIEMLGWIVEEGKEYFIRWYENLVQEYKKWLEFVIDFDATPVILPGFVIAPDGVQIASRVRGKKQFDVLNVSLHFVAGLKNGMWIPGFALKEKLGGQSVFGAHLLDFYLAHPDLFPDELKNKGWICFWGTIYRGEIDFLHYVRCLKWVDNRLVPGIAQIDTTVWHNDNLAAVSADQK